MFCPLIYKLLQPKTLTFTGVEMCFGSLLKLYLQTKC